MRVLVTLILLSIASCSDTRVVQRRPDSNETPLGGGPPVNHHPDADPFGRESRRSEVRFQYRGDNGTPETRIDPRVDRRTQ
jgi:hypothetical protein